MLSALPPTPMSAPPPLCLLQLWSTPGLWPGTSSLLRLHHLFGDSASGRAVRIFYVLTFTALHPQAQPLPELAAHTARLPN